MFRSRTLHKKLDTIARICLATFHEVKAMQSAIDDLKVAVEEAVGELKRLSKQISDAADDPQEVRQLTTQLRTTLDGLKQTSDQAKQ